MSHKTFSEKDVIFDFNNRDPEKWCVSAEHSCAYESIRYQPLARRTRL